MKTALITTTIFVPKVIERYRQLGPDVAIIVAGDQETPPAETRRFVESLGNATYLSDEDQAKLGYESSEIIGWNKIMRRNLPLLEAIRQKSDVIISIDDDNLPVGDDYFTSFDKVFNAPYSGLSASNGQLPGGWFNIGTMLLPNVFHRSFSYERRQPHAPFQLRPCTNRRISVAAGLWIGDPDIDAMDRITNQPLVQHFSDLLHTGVSVERGTFSPFNTQNTGFVAELAPLLMVLVGVGRYDDIWASYIAERIMMETDSMCTTASPTSGRNAIHRTAGATSRPKSSAWSTRRNSAATCSNSSLGTRHRGEARTPLPRSARQGLHPARRV